MTNTKDVNYQNLSQQLDDVLARLQQPDISVDEAVQLYEQGLKLVASLEATLKKAENKIAELELKSPGA